MSALWRAPARPAVRAIYWLRAAAADVPVVARRTMSVRPWAGRGLSAAGAPYRYIAAPAWHAWVEGTLTPSAWAVRSYRVAHWLWTQGLPSAAFVVSLPARIGSGADLHPQALIGVRFKLAHGFGVVVGETAEIGDDCLLLQGVTLGVRHVGEPVPFGVRVHPRLGNRVRVGAGAVLLGPITVGDDVQIGANSVVLTDIPSGATAVGVPARVVRCGAAARPAPPALLCAPVLTSRPRPAAHPRPHHPRPRRPCIRSRPPLPPPPE